MAEPVITDTRAAALFAGVAPATIRSWLHRGLITHRGKDGRRTLVDLREIRDLLDTKQAA